MRKAQGFGQVDATSEGYCLDFFVVFGQLPQPDLYLLLDDLRRSRQIPLVQLQYGSQALHCPVSSELGEQLLNRKQRGGVAESTFQLLEEMVDEWVEDCSSVIFLWIRRFHVLALGLSPSHPWHHNFSSNCIGEGSSSLVELGELLGRVLPEILEMLDRVPDLFQGLTVMGLRVLETTG